MQHCICLFLNDNNNNMLTRNAYVAKLSLLYFDLSDWTHITLLYFQPNHGK